MVCSFFQSSQYFWYLYYIVAYTVSLKKIRINEALASSSKANTANDSADAAVLQTAQGALWETTKRDVA